MRDAGGGYGERRPGSEAAVVGAPAACRACEMRRLPARHLP